MGNLIRMDLYRMNKARGFRVCLILAFALALAATPLEWLLFSVGKTLAPESAGEFGKTADLCGMIANPVSSLTVMLALLSAVIFFNADMENGYIKNIAGQMPRKGYSILSRFIAVIPHNLAFMLAALAGNVIGTLLFRRIVTEGSVLASAGTFLLRLLLMQSLCTILVLIVSSLRIKSLGMILAVLLGLPLMGLIYMGINTGLQQLFGRFTDITPYMPDQVLRESSPETIRALLVSAVTIGIFLPLSIRVFDQKDVK